MSYKFRPDEPLSAGFRRSAREQLDEALGELREGINEDPVGAVHSARKAIKKERSLLRLARGTMSPSERKRENAALRNAAQHLSGRRDADVMFATLDELSDRFAGQLPLSTFEAIRQQLEATHQSASETSSSDARAIQELAGVRMRVDGWKLSTGGWKAIDSGLLQAYKRGRKSFRQAGATRSADDLHAWRKCVKDLWYQERLLAPGCGPTVAGQAKDAHRVADLLGDDHDLSLLREALTAPTMAAPVDTDAVIELIDHRRAELQTEALQIGERIYAEKSKAFRRRMRRSWRAGRAAASAELGQRPAELALATRAPHRA
jgi:CHAD domain-containing protein